MPEYRKPPCEQIEKNKLGKGGNGAVYVANDPNYACKIFSVDKELALPKKRLRYERFCQEIVVQKELAKKMTGVLPVEDYYFPENMSEEQPAWFLMPKAEKFNIRDGKSLTEKIRDLIELGKIIESLHALGMAHRDIKPENILCYNNQIHLTDYGLVWVDGESNLTNYPERMGPIKILPPEQEACVDINGILYYKSDVYLFAKVAWMYLKRDTNGFKGPYNRGADQIYLDRKKLNCDSLEPFHRMMSGATIDDWNKRIELSECLEYLNKQLMIAREEMNSDELNECILHENISLFDELVPPNVKKYNESDGINALLDSVVARVEVDFFDGLEHLEVFPTRYKCIGDKLFVFYEDRPNRTTRRLFFNVVQVEKSEKKIVFELDSIEQNQIAKYKREQDLVMSRGTRALIELR